MSAVTAIREDDDRTLAGLGVLAAEAVIAPPTQGVAIAALISARACMRAVADTTADALARRLLREEIASIDALIGPARGRAA